MNLTYYPPVLKDGRKVVRINPIEVESVCEKWEDALIGHVMGGMSSFKDVLKLNSVWKFVEAPKNLKLHWKPICADRMTAEVEKISYASVLVEVDIIQELPEELYLEKVDGLILVQEIEYELKPQVCKACHQMVHDQDECKKGKEKPQQAPSPQKQKGNINIRRPWRPKWLLKEAQAKASTSAPTPDMGKMEKQLANIQVDLIGCLEAKIQAHNVDKVRSGFGHEWTIYVDYPTTLSGRIWLFWKDDKVEATTLT
ncbi:hypothetical protein FXO38_15791 [Capsicum annuum]|nr:hypothetical protein FXO37_29186 [Capsicum annuum]KAF3653115.1 hypothetical protein FXO38_15791 [Capsicum annuum]